MGFTYDPTFPIRGLYYDKSKGCLMKLDFFGSIEPDGCYFGRRRVLDIVSLYFIPRFVFMQHQVSYCCHFDFVLNFLCKITHNLNCVVVLCIAWLALSALKLCVAGFIFNSFFKHSLSVNKI